MCRLTDSAKGPGKLASQGGQELIRQTLVVSLSGGLSSGQNPVKQLAKKSRKGPAESPEIALFL